jgi:hypothetical protein
MENTGQLQLNLFQKIREVLPPGASLVNEVAELLNITIDSAYRRIRGEKSLIIEELFILSSKYNVSMDDIFTTNTKGDSFLCRIIEVKDISMEGYLKNLYDNLLYIQSLKNPEIIYFAKDIPIFHHFHFPMLAIFKIFFWSKTVMHLPELKDKKFDPDAIEQSVLDMGKKVLKLYSIIPSAEIWNEETINSVLRQLEYYYTSGIIVNKEIVLRICDDLKAMVDHISTQAEQGGKSLPGTAPLIPCNYKLYNNEVILGDNSICVTSDNLMMTFLTLNVLDLMVTTERSFCEREADYLRTMMKKSCLISSDSEKERTRFFNLLFQRVDATKERIIHL